jgi:hypothetical protein
MDDLKKIDRKEIAGQLITDLEERIETAKSMLEQELTKPFHIVRIHTGLTCVDFNDRGGNIFISPKKGCFPWEVMRFPLSKAKRLASVFHDENNEYGEAISWRFATSEAIDRWGKLLKDLNGMLETEEEGSEQ